MPWKTRVGYQFSAIALPANLGIMLFVDIPDLSLIIYHTD